jgi:membrane-bound metal-dependent hydrolase YbcI (DUF457 family)
VQIALSGWSLRGASSERTLQIGTLLGLCWMAAVAAQHVAPDRLAWIALDMVGHGAAAGLFTVGLLPRFGARPVLSAIAAGTLIDFDHAVAAGSLDPLRMASLDARPPTHSLVTALVLGVLTWRLIGAAAGYAVSAGIVAHLLGDAVEQAGAPLLFPFVRDPYLHVPLGALVGITLVITAFSVWLGRRRSRDVDGERQWRPGGAASR